MLRSAPYVLVQPLDVVEKRLWHLRKVLGLTPSPELEKVKTDVPIFVSVMEGGVRRRCRRGVHPRAPFCIFWQIVVNVVVFLPSSEIAPCFFDWMFHFFFVVVCCAVL